MRLSLLLVLFAVLCIRCGTGHTPKEQEEQIDAVPDTLILALDWSPNVLHAGFFWAEMNGFFKEENLHIEWFSPEIDGYEKKPVQRLLDAEVDLAIGPSEHLFFFNDTSEGKQAIALASLLQRGQSAFCVKRSSGITSPAGLQGKKYLGYNTPLENEVLKAMMQQDGATGDFQVQTPGRLKVWDAFIEGRGDAAWIFTHWEGALATRDGIDLNIFRLEDYGVPYGYSSVIMALKSKSMTDPKYRRFLKAMKRGYRELANAGPELVSVELSTFAEIDNFQDTALLRLALVDITPAFFTDTHDWGLMQTEVWENWQQWVSRLDEGKPQLPSSTHFTNDLLK